MGVNPMQKMKRNSTLTGIVIGLMIGLVLCVLLFIFLTSNGGAIALSNNGDKMVEAYVLGQNVNSGDIITPNMLIKTKVLTSMIPANYVDVNLLSTIQLQDEFGNVLFRNLAGELYMMIQESADYKKTSDNLNVIIEQEGQKYYKTRLSTGQKEYIEFTTVPTVAKINMKMNSVVTTDALSKSDEIVKNDLRKQEYNMIALPTNLNVGDFIDIRLQLPNGGDYIVVSKKKVLESNASTVWLNMYEEEIELMSNAIIEYYIMAGSKLYATTYTEPGLQAASTGTYVPNQVVATLIQSNPDIKSYINKERYSDNLKAIRNNHINSEVNKYSEDSIENIEKNMQEEIKSLKEAREAYFGALNSVE